MAPSTTTPLAVAAAVATACVVLLVLPAAKRKYALQAAAAGPGQGPAAAKVEVEEKAAQKAVFPLNDNHQRSDICLCIDIGSSSVRCAAFAVPSCEKVAGSDFQDQFSLLDRKTGVADVATIMEHVESTVCKCLHYLRKQGVESSVKGVGFTSFAMNLVGVDSQGNAVTPVYTYADTNDSTAQMGVELRETLESRGGVASFYNSTGVPVHRSYAPAQLLRVLKDAPHQFQAVVQWQSITGFILSKWTGKASIPMSFSEASWTGLFDWRKLDWCWPLIDILGLDKETLPPLADYDSGRADGVPLSGLTSEYAERWPELSAVPLFLSVGDGAAANIGSKCYLNNRIAITIGTSAATRVMFKDSQLPNGFVVPKGLWCYRVSRESILIGGALTDGGSVFEWMQQTIRLGGDVAESIQSGVNSGENIQRIMDAATNMAPDSHGLTVLPFLSGERAPGWKDDARAVLFGLRRNTTGIDVLRAGFEAVSHRLTLVVNLIRESGVVSRNPLVIASGAALTKNRLWRQILADSIGVTVITEPETEATSRGVASLMSLYAYHDRSIDRFIQFHQDDLESSKVASRAVPEIENHAIYTEARKRQSDLYNKLM
jgi:gluconokinase